MIAELKEQVAKAACFLFLWDKLALCQIVLMKNFRKGLSN